MPLTTDRPADFAFCPHDRGPGIAVCLRCRADAHRNAAMTRRRILGRVGAGAAVAIVLAVAMNSAVAARAAAGGARGAKGPAAAETFEVAQASATEAATRSSATPAPMLAAAIGLGHTDLEDGRSVERGGDRIVVHFDTPLSRTRRHDKFERVVRETLPAVYGAYADSALAAVPVGALSSEGDLLTELPVRGVRLPAHGGWVITLWPATRPGQDGPLVVSYRISLARER